MSSILEQARSEAYQDGWSQGAMAAEGDCPDCPPVPSRLTWWLLGVMCGALLAGWLV